MKSATLLRNTRSSDLIYTRRASPLPRGSAKPSHEQIPDHLDAVVAGQRTGSGQGREALAWCLAGQDVPLVLRPDAESDMARRRCSAGSRTGRRSKMEGLWHRVGLSR